jgi:hypothetical protein
MKYNSLDFIEYHQMAVIFHTTGVVITQGERFLCNRLFPLVYAYRKGLLLVIIMTVIHWALREFYHSYMVFP